MTTARRATCLAVLLLLVGCSDGRGSSDPAGGTVKVVASSALTDVLATLAHDFETRHPGSKVEVAFDADSALPGRAGASDVVVFEGTIPAANLSGPTVPLARGQLVLAVPKDNPLTLTGLADLARPEVRVALCAATEPCGATTAAVLTAAGASVATALPEPTVRGALARVVAGTADAALVYRSDVRQNDDIATVEFAESSASLATFSAARSATAPNQGMADLFLDLLAGPSGRDALATAGFRPLT